MKKLVFLVIAVLLLASLAGCSSNNGSTDNNTNSLTDNDTSSTETAQWAAYNFGDTVKPSSGGSGKIKSFTIDSKDTQDGKVREFKLEGTYLGTEMVSVATQKMVTNLSTYASTTENVTTSLECYKVNHHVTEVKDDTGDYHPAWADVTLWIPTGDLKTTTQYFMIYPKMTYVDSDNNTGEWSWYLTEAMQNEMSNPPSGTTVSYLPISEGEGNFYGYNDYAFYGLYGYGYSWFQAFAEGGAQELQVGSWGATVGGYGCTYNGAKVDKTIGGYTFHAWSVEQICTGGGSSAGWKAVFSPDLALPIYSQFGGTGGGSSSSFEYTLTDLKLG